jgi:hypothetical protein
MTLEILDAENHLVRRYASSDKPEPIEKIATEHPIPMYWVRPTQILSSEAGMHRFVWDLHFAPPQALSHEFPISAIVHDTPKYPLGAWVLPGRYEVKLTVDGKVYTQPLIVKMDLRIKTSDADLRKQFAMMEGSIEAMNQSYEALAQVQSVRAQLKVLSEKAGKGPLADSLAALDKQAAELGGVVETPFFGLPSSAKKPETFSTSNQHFATLLNVADSADTAPTTQATAVFEELGADLHALLSRWQKVKQSDIPVLNQSLKKAKLPEVDFTKPPTTPPAADAGDGDEP